MPKAGNLIAWAAILSAAAGAYPAPLLTATEATRAATAATVPDSVVALAEESAAVAQVEYLEALYGLLRIHCERGDRTRAYKTLDALLAAGWWDHRRLRADADLALISQEDRFRTMVRKAWSKQYIGMLERESRDVLQKPAEVMAALALRPGERVADIGAGSGYFTLRIAEAVGDDGRVIAIDIRQEMLDHIADRLRGSPLQNVELKLAPADDPQLPAGSVDTILMVDTIHYVQDRTDYARKLRAALTRGGRLVIIDFRYDPHARREFAPPLEQQVPQETLDAEMAAAGFAVVQTYDFLPEQYFVVYAPRNAGVTPAD